MNESGPEEEERFYEQQERADELFKQLKEDLKLDKKQATQCLVDWVYVNADDVDYLATAAEKDEGVELPEFMAAAAAAWLKERKRRAPDQKAGFSADEILETLKLFLMGIRDIGR